MEGSFGNFGVMIWFFWFWIRLSWALESFVFPEADEAMALRAREFGAEERKRFQRAILNTKSDEEIMERYAEHLSGCSAMGSEFGNNLALSANENNKRMEIRHSVLSAIGFDPITARLFTLPEREIDETIRNVCLQNELQFQCAFGFLGDPEKIRLHIEEMKEEDGNVKVMFERECGNPKSKPRLYFCLSESIDRIAVECTQSLEAFNRTRLDTKNQISKIFAETISKTEMPSESAFHSIIRLEGRRCRAFGDLEKCALRVIGEECGDESPAILRSLLRIGQLRRERGDELHEHFLDSNFRTHTDCRGF